MLSSTDSLSDPADNSQAPSGRNFDPGELDILATVLKYHCDAFLRARDRVSELLAQTTPMGYSSKPAMNVDGIPVQLGAVSHSFPTPSVRIENNEEFLAWLDATYPSEVEERTVVVRQVRDGFFKRFTVTKLGRLKGPGGECDVPGLGVTPGRASSVTVRDDKDVIEALIDEGLVPDVVWVMDQVRELTPNGGVPEIVEGDVA